MKKLNCAATALLLALCLLLTACGGPAAPASSPEPDAAALFDSAVSALSPEAPLAYSVEALDVRSSVLGESELALSAQYEALPGAGGDYSAKSACTLSGSLDETYTETYSGGFIYSDRSGFLCKSPMSREDFDARRIPALLLDAALYGSMGADIGEDGSCQLTFGEASAPEAWLGAEEDAQLLSASGSASLDASGALTSMSYEAEYLSGGLTRTLSAVVTLSDASALAAAELPSGAESCPQFEDIDAADLLCRAYRRLESAPSLKAEKSVATSIAVTGSVSSASTLWLCGEGEGFAARGDYRVTFTDGSGSESYAYTDVCSGGVYTFTEEGAEPETSSFSPDMARPVYFGEINAVAPLPDQLASAVLTDAGDCWLVEYEYAPDAADSLRDGALMALYGDLTTLPDAADGYALDSASGYMVVDKQSRLPISHNIAYQGTYTVYGSGYPLSYEYAVRLTAPFEGAYREISGETAEPEPETPATPLFYKVTGAEGQEMWLLGSIHAGDERTAYLPGQLYSALYASDALAVEFDTTAFTVKLESDPMAILPLIQYVMYMDGSTVAEHISPELYEKALLALKISGGYSASSDMMRPFMWTSSIEDGRLSGGSLDYERGVDVRLIALAGEKGLEIRDIESAELQFGMLSGFSDQLQEYMLRDTVETSRLEYLEELSRLYELWCAGDEAALTEYITSPPQGETTEEELALYAEYQDKMLTQRNIGMAETADGYLQSGDTVFFTVGLGHLLGEEGIIALLRGMGYTVEQVSYA